MILVWLSWWLTCAHKSNAGTSFNARFKYVTTNDGVMGIRVAAASDSTALYQCTQLSATDFRLVRLDPHWPVGRHAATRHDSQMQISFGCASARRGTGWVQGVTLWIRFRFQRGC